MKISLGNVVVALLLSTSLSLVVLPQPKPFPYQGRGISADVAAMVSLAQGGWRRLMQSGQP
jgi:hypothetical protein